MKNGTYFRVVLSLVVVGVFILGNGFAQEVSVTDYEVPVSSADRLLVDFSMNHATTGSDATASKGNLGGIYKRFYDSLPFGYTIDILGSGLLDRNIETDEYDSTYQVNGDASVKKYLMQSSALAKDMFGSLRASTDMHNHYDRPASAVTVGLGYGRYIEATALAQAVRIEEFLMEEGALSGHLPKSAILDLSKIINREEEYKDKYGATYEKEWYEDMEAVMRESGKLKDNQLGAIGALRIEEVLERESIADRFYGWDVALGSKFDITTPYEDQERPVANLDVTASYARPIAWKWQINERLSVNTPFDDFGSAYSLSLSSDISYELSNRIDLRLRHLLQLDKLGERDAESSHSFGASFIYYIENNVNLVVTEQLEKVPGEDLASNFTVLLNYRVF
ncbi:MAG: hypothetical protein OXN17_02940 [Candidatus Poribacteria bacterium]|nr:hypothetical protein [Candidatus Poribacteria bacterium]